MNRMGRITFLMALASMLMMPAFSVQVYRSNSIGQLLEPVRDLEPVGWFLDVDGDDTTLYHDGSIVSKIVRTNGQEHVEQEDGSVVTRRYENSLLVSESTVSVQGATLNILYTYDTNEKLQGYTVSENGDLQLIVSYLRAKDGSVAAIRSIDLAGTSLWEYLGRDLYVQGTDGMSVKMTRLPGNVIIRESYSDTAPVQSVDITYDDEIGDLTVTISDDSDTKQETTYSGTGNILKETTYLQDIPTTSTDFRYDEKGSILTSVYSDVVSGRMVYRTFEDGILISEREEEDESVIRFISYHDDGTRTETLYDNGTPYADVTYAPDGKRVLSVSYR